VRDWPAAVRWYTDVLGLAVAYMEEDDQFCLFETGGAALALAGDHPEQAASTAENRLAPSFQVADLDGELERLRAAGVRIDPVIDGADEGYRLARIWDPEGNRIGLHA
jgi:catechol 2,3-dioxygenase-like lactoylglutathione lyase family enzyme